MTAREFQTYCRHCKELGWTHVRRRCLFGPKHFEPYVCESCKMPMLKPHVNSMSQHSHVHRCNQARLDEISWAASGTTP